MNRLNNRESKCMGKRVPTGNYQVEVKLGHLDKVYKIQDLRTILDFKEANKSNLFTKNSNTKLINSSNEHNLKRAAEINPMSTKRLKQQHFVSSPTSYQEYSPFTNNPSDFLKPQHCTPSNIMNMYGSLGDLKSNDLMALENEVSVTNSPYNPMFAPLLTTNLHGKIDKPFESSNIISENRMNQSNMPTFKKINNKCFNPAFLPIINSNKNEDFNSTESTISSAEIFINRNSNESDQKFYGDTNYLTNQNLWWMKNRSNIQPLICNTSGVQQFNKEADYYTKPCYFGTWPDSYVQQSISNISNSHLCNGDDILINQNHNTSYVQPSILDVNDNQQFNAETDYIPEQNFFMMENRSNVQPSLSGMYDCRLYNTRDESSTSMNHNSFYMQLATSYVSDDYLLNNEVNNLTNSNLRWLENRSIPVQAQTSTLETDSYLKTFKGEINEDEHNGLKINSINSKEIPNFKLPKGKLTNFFLPQSTIEYTDILNPKKQPTKEMKIRMENALEMILHTTRDTKYTAATVKQKLEYEQEFQRYIKPIVRQRIKKVLLGKVVGSYQDIVDCYRVKYPKETDCNLAKAFTDYTHNSSIPDLIKSDDPEDFFHLNMKRLINTKIKNIFILMRNMYDNADQELQDLIEKTSDEEQDEAFFEKMMGLMIESQLPKLLPQFKNEIVNMIYHKEVCRAIELKVLKKH